MPQLLDPLVGRGVGAARPMRRRGSAGRGRSPPATRGRLDVERAHRASAACAGTRRRQQRPPGGDDGVDVHLGEAVGRVSLAAFAVAGGSDCTGCTAGRRARCGGARPAAAYRHGIEGPNTRQHRRADGRGQVHRPGVAGQQQSGTAAAGRQHDQIVRALQPQRVHAVARQARRHLAHDGLVAGRAGEDDRRAHVGGEHRRRVGKPLDRPLLDRAAARRVHGQQRMSGVGGMPGQLRQRRARRCTCGVGHRQMPEWRAARGRGARQRLRRQVEGALDQREAVVGDMPAAVELHDVGEQRAAAGVREPDSSPRARHRQQPVRADVALEVDRQVVAAACATASPDAPARAAALRRLRAQATRRRRSPRW